MPIDRTCLAAFCTALVAVAPAFAQGAPPPTPPIGPPLAGPPAASSVPAAKPPIAEVARRFPAELLGMKRVRLEQAAPGKGEGIQALYEGKTGRATVLVEPRGTSPVPDGLAAPTLATEVSRITELDAKHVVKLLGPRYWQAEPKVKQLSEKNTGMGLLCGEVERRAGDQKKTPEQIRMVNLSCVTGAAGRLLTVLITTPFKGKAEESARKAQDYFVMAMAQAVSGKPGPR